jgi:hypothetical protein
MKAITYREIFTIGDVYEGTAFDSLFDADQHTKQKQAIEVDNE